MGTICHVTALDQYQVYPWPLCLAICNCQLSSAAAFIPSMQSTSGLVFLHLSLSPVTCWVYQLLGLSIVGTSATCLCLLPWRRQPKSQTSTTSLMIGMTYHQVMPGRPKSWKICYGPGAEQKQSCRFALRCTLFQDLILSFASRKRSSQKWRIVSAPWIEFESCLVCVSWKGNPQISWQQKLCSNTTQHNTTQQTHAEKKWKKEKCIKLIQIASWAFLTCAASTRARTE